jgi:hypothetical protein
VALETTGIAGRNWKRDAGKVSRDSSSVGIAWPFQKQMWVSERTPRIGARSNPLQHDFFRFFLTLGEIGD